MENHPFTDDFPIKMPIDHGFPVPCLMTGGHPSQLVWTPLCATRTAWFFPYPYLRQACPHFVSLCSYQQEKSCEIIIESLIELLPLTHTQLVIASYHHQPQGMKPPWLTWQLCCGDELEGVGLGWNGEGIWWKSRKVWGKKMETQWSPEQLYSGFAKSISR